MRPLNRNPIRLLYDAVHSAGLRVFHFIEIHFNRWPGEKYNFFYYLGAIPIILLFVLLFTGLYMFLYYSMAVDTTYESVKYMTEQAPAGGFVRGLHRYAADAMVFFVVLHLLRVFFEGRYQKHRWLAWVTGVVLLIFILIQGITGYFMPLDSTSRFVMEKTAELLGSLRIMGETLSRSFASVDLMGKWIMWVILIIHFAIPLIFIFLIFFHVKRIARARIFPPRAVTVGLVLALAAVAIIFPVRMLGPADAGLSSYLEELDWFYLFLAPLMRTQPFLLIWAGFAGVVALLVVVPWLRKPAPINHADLELAKCTGCTLCSQDCPYEAIRMQPRTDGQKFKLEASVTPDLCAGCGICVASCDFEGMHLKDLRLDQIHAGLEQGFTEERNWLGVVCERHLKRMPGYAGGILPGLPAVRLLDGAPCSGMAGPALLKAAREQGARGLLIGACPDGDCFYREGNQWIQDRALNLRKPNFKRLRGELPIILLRFNERQGADFIKEAAQEIENSEREMGVHPSPYPPVIRALRGPGRIRSVLVSTAVFALLGGLFLLGATGRGSFGTLPLDRSYSTLRLDFFYQTRRRSCDLSVIPESEYQRAVDRIAGSIQLSNLTEEARERLLAAARDNVKEKYCSRDRLPLRIRVEVDGQRALEREFYPAGVQNDGQVYVFQKVSIDPGDREVAIIADEMEDSQVVRSLRHDLSQDFPGGHVVFIDLDRAKHEFFVRPAKSFAGAPPEAPGSDAAGENFSQTR